MIRFELAFALLTLALWIYCLVEVISADERDIRNLPKVAWLLIVLFFPFAGSVAWLVAGRPSRTPAGSSPYQRSAPGFPEYDRPGRAAAIDPEGDEAFLRRVRERAEEQRRAYREQRRSKDNTGTEEGA